MTIIYEDDTTRVVDDCSVCAAYPSNTMFIRFTQYTKCVDAFGNNYWKEVRVYTDGDMAVILNSARAIDSIRHTLTQHREHLRLHPQAASFTDSD